MSILSRTADNIRGEVVRADLREHRRALATGLLAIAVFFGGLGAAASALPLDAALIAQGTVIVAGRSETVASAVGGRVLAVLVREGDQVRRGDVLIRVDTAERAAQLASLRARKIELEAQRAQLLAADQGATRIALPVGWSPGSGEAANALQRRQTELDALNASLAGDLAILDQRHVQIAQQITGLSAQRVAVVEQSRIADAEIANIRILIDKGLATRPRLHQEERGRAQLSERIAGIDAEMAALGEKQAEIRLQKSGLLNESSVETRSQSAEIDRLLAELEPGITAAEDAVRQGDVRATVDGRVMSMAVRNAGDAVSPSEPLVGIVPEGRSLVVEARISPRDGDDLSLGMTADIRLVGVGGRMARTYVGKVVQVSPDRFVDERTGEAWFNVQIELAEEEVADPDLASALRPGIPAEVLIPLRKRTALEYLLEPLNQTLWRAMRES